MYYLQYILQHRQESEKYHHQTKVISEAVWLVRLCD